MAPYPTGAVTGMARRWSAYTVCGVIGIAAATGLAAVALQRRGEPAVVSFMLLTVGLLGFVVVAKSTELILRREALVALHQLAMVTALTFPVAAVSGVPVLIALDAVAVGLTALIAVGRVGCLLVGCCHGCPSRWGVRYGPSHVAFGFPAYLSGVMLVPVQALESMLASTVAAATLTTIWAGEAPGSAAANATVAYATGRFLLEFWRGDGPRPSWAGLTHAQWTAWAIAVLVSAASVGRDWDLWHPAVVGVLTGLVLGVALHRWVGGPSAALGDVRHQHELARALRVVGCADSGFPPQLVQTSLGVAVSGGVTDDGGRRLSHYTLSFPSGVNHRQMFAIARLVHVLQDASARREVLVRGPSRIQIVLEHVGHPSPC